MHMNRGLFLIANLALALCLSGSAAQKQEPGGETEILRAKLVNTMRLLNTVQMGYRNDNNNRPAACTQVPKTRPAAISPPRMVLAATFSVTHKPGMLGIF